MTTTSETTREQRHIWPEEGLSGIPDWIYTSDEIYDREIESIFHGPTWNYVGLESEIPNFGDHRRSHIGATPVVVCRAADGGVNVFENRCHQGSMSGQMVVEDGPLLIKERLCVYDSLSIPNSVIFPV